MSGTGILKRSRAYLFLIGLFINGLAAVRIFFSALIFSVLALLPCYTFAQAKKDTTESVSIAKKAFREGMRLISTDPNDTIVGEQSIDSFQEYAGRIIRTINVRQLGFEKSIYDSTIQVARIVSHAANTLHRDTREVTLRQHLFVQVNESLNPYKLADNERFLRDKDFVLDSRILVTPVDGTDSVDLMVITRDVFSLGVRVGGSFPSAPEIGVYDANIDGRGQRIGLDMLIDKTRTPKFGYALSYRKSSIFGSLVNFEMGYTQLDNRFSIGDENEFSMYWRIDRPLVSPYSRWAGGMEVSRNWSSNIYDKPDSVFLSYKYYIYDSWIGCNFGIKKEMENRGRHFLAVRYFDGHYPEPNYKLEAREHTKYNDAFGYLAEATFYKQNFYKTRYVYGFGRTEDVPSGFSLGVAGGYMRLLDIERSYSSIKFSFGRASIKGNFYRVLFESGGFVRRGKAEDIVLASGVSYFTRLWNLKRYKMRSTIAATYARIFNQNITGWLKVNEAEIPGFVTDSLQADQRVSLHLESALFTPWSLLGFRYAPFAAVDIVPVQCIACDGPNKIFWGFSGGIRTRNENLIFGTMELKITYIPLDEYGQSKAEIGFKQNLRVKNSGTFVRPPALVTYN